MSTSTEMLNEKTENSNDLSLSKLEEEIKRSNNIDENNGLESLEKNEFIRELFMKEISDKIEFFRLGGASEEYLAPYIAINDYLRNENYSELQKYLNERFSDSKFDSLIDEIIGYMESDNKTDSISKLKNFFNSKGVKCRVEGDRIRVDKIQENGEFDSQTISYLSLFLLINTQRGE